MSGGKSAGAAKNFNQGMVTVKRPNGSRLSCGAGLEHSQGEFYHTARKTFSGSLGTGAASFKRMLGRRPAHGWCRMEYVLVSRQVSRHEVSERFGDPNEGVVVVMNDNGRRRARVRAQNNGVPMRID